MKGYGGRDKEVLLAEYKQVSEFIRHYNVMLWTIASIILPFTWASLYLSIEFGREYIVPLMIGSIGLSILWTFIYERWNLYRRVGFKKLHELEKILNLNFHHKVTLSDKGFKMKLVGHKTVVRLHLALIILAWITLIYLT